MNQNRQKKVKTFELEDQYAIVFGLALWPQEPHEIHFFKKNWFSLKVFVQKCKKMLKLGRNGARMEMTGLELLYMGRESIN